MAVHGWAPRLGVIPWIVGWSVFLLWLGGLPDLPKAVLDATPFAPLPQRPVETFTSRRSRHRCAEWP